MFPFTKKVVSAYLDFSYENPELSGMLTAAAAITSIYNPLIALPVASTLGKAIIVDGVIIGYETAKGMVQNISLPAPPPRRIAPPTPEQIQQTQAQRIEQIKAEYAREVQVALAHQDEDEREAYLAGAQKRLREKLARLGVQ